MLHTRASWSKDRTRSVRGNRAGPYTRTGVPSLDPIAGSGSSRYDRQFCQTSEILVAEALSLVGGFSRPSRASSSPRRLRGSAPSHRLTHQAGTTEVPTVCAHTTGIWFLAFANTGKQTSSGSIKHYLACYLACITLHYLACILPCLQGFSTP